MSPHSIWKYPIPPRWHQDTFVLEIPRGAQFLAAQTQRGEPQMWFLVNPEAEKEKRTFVVVGTGHNLDGNLIHHLHHLATFQLYNGDLVLHLFEGK